VHEDMKEHFALYPQNWGLKKPDANIDHRRVPNLMRYFERQGWLIPVGTNTVYLPGDIATWNLGNGVTHIGIVSDRRTATKVPFVIHNIGQGAREADILFAFTLTGHYRVTGSQKRER
jgi:uncharacterized protein